MVEKSYSDAKPSKVSVEKVGKFTSVWLRKNIIEDTADQGPDGSGSIAFWTWDEVFFSVPGNMTEDEASERFDELWSAHRDDGRPAEEVAAEARAAAEKASETAAATQAVANEAREVAQTGTPAMRQAMQLAISSSDLAPEDYAGFADLYDAFDPDAKYKRGRMVTYEGGVYRCTKNTAPTVGTAPDADPDHWERVDVTADGVEVWGPEKSYNKGDRVHYPTEADPVYVSKKNNNTVEPGTNEKYWTKEE